jgi:hypothetical protein
MITTTLNGVSNAGITAASTLAVAPAIDFTIPSTTAIQTGTTYTFTPTLTGGLAPVVFSKTGSLPAGLSLDTTDGRIFGTPTSTTQTTFSLIATDANGSSVTKSVTMNFTAGEQSSLTISPTSDSVDFNGTAYTKTVTFSLSGRLSSNSTSNFTYTVDNSSTATSCQISGSTALVRTITAASQGTCVIKVTDPAYGSYLATTRTYTVTFNKSTIATPSAPNRHFDVDQSDLPGVYRRCQLHRSRV